jgi:hypothetical protein
VTSMLAAAQKLINMILRAAYAEGGAKLSSRAPVYFTSGYPYKTNRGAMMNNAYMSTIGVSNATQTLQLKLSNAYLSKIVLGSNPATPLSHAFENLG